MKVADPKTTASRAFVRSLNILLKFARLYGYEHTRTIEHLDTAWRELRAAIPVGTEGGLLLGATGSQLLLDGVPLEGSPAEKQFAQLLSAAGLASVQFFPSVTEEELGRFSRAFPTGKSKPAELAAQLKSVLAGAQGIRINEICFVATDSRFRDASVAAQLAVSTLGEDQEQFKQWLNDPQKLLEMIAAAQGSRSGGGSGAGGESGGSGNGPGNGNGGGTGAASGAEPGAAGGSGGFYHRVASSEEAPAQSNVPGADPNFFTGPVADASPALFLPPNSGISSGIAGSGIGRGTGSGPGRGVTGEPTEDEILGILSALTSMGQVGAGGGSGMAAAGAFHEQMSLLPGRAQDTLKAALAELAAHAPDTKPDQSTLVQLAEHLAIRFALERYEKGEVKVNAVRQMLDRMNHEIEGLRKILGQHEEKMVEAGLAVESHRELLDRQFWASVPESAKRDVLLSEEAWCIPPKNVQSYVAELMEHGDLAEAISILRNYASCADSEEPDARKRAATGLSELAGLYAQADPKALSEALRHVGLRLNVEQDMDLQSLVSAAFVRLSQEAASQRCFPAMEQALDLLAGVEAQRPGIAKTLRMKLGIEERVPEFVEEALRAREISAGLTGVLRQLPQTAMEQLSLRFNRCQLRDDVENVASLAHDLGEESLQYLRSTVRGGPVAEAVEMIGLLAKLDPRATEVFLPGRLKDFPRSAQDRIVRQIAASGAAGRCRILLAVLDHLDTMVMPLVIDEVGLTEDREGLGRLLTIADGDLPVGAAPYLRVKAIEALGRLQAPEAISTLRRIAETRKLFGWQYPQELRIASLQALEKLDPAWTREFLPKSGIETDDMALAPVEAQQSSKFVRQRRHPRVRLQKSL